MHIDVATGAARAGPHSNQAETAAAAVGSTVQAAAVILNGESNVVALAGESDPHVVRVGMACDIRQRFLRDAEEMGLRFVGQAAGVGGVYRHLDSGTRGETIGQPAEASLQSEIVED